MVFALRTCCLGYIELEKVTNMRRSMTVVNLAKITKIIQRMMVVDTAILFQVK